MCICSDAYSHPAKKMPDIECESPWLEEILDLHMAGCTTAITMYVDHLGFAFLYRFYRCTLPYAILRNPSPSDSFSPLPLSGKLWGHGMDEDMERKFLGVLSKGSRLLYRAIISSHLALLRHPSMNTSFRAKAHVWL